MFQLSDIRSIKKGGLLNLTANFRSQLPFGRPVYRSSALFIAIWDRLPKGIPCHGCPGSSFLAIYFPFHTPGSSQAITSVVDNAEKPRAMLIGEITFNPSASVIPLIRVITQNALSVIQETGLLPAPIAIAK